MKMSVTQNLGLQIWSPFLIPLTHEPGDISPIDITSSELEIQYRNKLAVKERKQVFNT